MINLNYWLQRLRVKNICCGLGLIAALCPQTIFAQNILVVTEDLYPLHYTVNNEIHGAGAELVERVLKSAGFTYNMQMYPWARAYRIAKTQPDVLIFSLLRAPNREHRFKWVGEIIPLKYSLIRLKSRPEVAPLSLADLSQYNIGVLRNSAVHEYLQSKCNNKLTVIDDREQNFKMLLDGRVDLIANNAVTLDFACEGLQIDCKQFEPVFALEEIANGLYMAFSQQTNDATVLRVQRAYREIREHGEYDEIMQPILHPKKMKHQNRDN